MIKVLEKVAMKSYSNRGADELLEDDIYKVAGSQTFTNRLVRRLINSSVFKMPVARFVKQQAKTAVTGDSKFEKDMSREIPVEDEIKTPLPLTGRSSESSKTSKDDKKTRR